MTLNSKHASAPRTERSDQVAAWLRLWWRVVLTGLALVAAAVLLAFGTAFGIERIILRIAVVAFGAACLHRAQRRQLEQNARAESSNPLTSKHDESFLFRNLVPLAVGAGIVLVAVLLLIR